MCLYCSPVPNPELEALTHKVPLTLFSPIRRYDFRAVARFWHVPYQAQAATTVSVLSALPRA